MKALVTGGAGFIGSHIADALLAKGHEVWILDDLSNGRRSNVPQGAHLIEGSVDADDVPQVLREVQPAAIFHHAAQVSVRESVADPAHDCSVNVRGTLRLAVAAAEAGTECLVFASSGGAIYGEPERLPVPEEHPIAPVSPYGVSKYCAEQYLGYVERSTPMRVVNLRYGNVYGPRQDPHGEAGVVAIFTGKGLQAEAMTINGDGEQTRDYVFVGDVVSANLKAWEHASARGAFNIGTGREASVLDIARAVAAAAGEPLRVMHGPAKPGEQRRIALNNQRAVTELGWAPAVSLEEGIARTVAWFKEHA